MCPQQQVLKEDDRSLHEVRVSRDERRILVIVSEIFEHLPLVNGLASGLLLFYTYDTLRPLLNDAVRGSHEERTARS